MVKTNNLSINFFKKIRNGKKKFLLSADEKLKLAAEISSKTAEQRFDKLSNLLVKSAKHIYSEKATYHELTEGMRAWVLKKSDLDQFKLTDESTIPFYPNLSWLHYERLLRVKDADARLWYLKEATREQWDYRTLQRNISSQYYYRLLLTPEHLRKEVSDEMRSLTSDFEKDKLKLRNMPLFKVGSVLDLSFYQELENSFFCLDDIQ